MKRIIYLACIILIIQVNKSVGVNVHDYAIIIQSNSDETTERAAQKLKEYWNKVNNSDIEIVNECPFGTIGIYVGQSYINHTLRDSINTLKQDGFLISIDTNGIFLTGKTKTGNLYAVNTFIEEYLGCMKLSCTEDYIPSKTQLDFKHSLKLYNPAFSFRRTLFKGQHCNAYRDWYKLEELSDWGMFVHTFNRLIPPKQYYDEHPEYFSLVNGRRLQDAQLCLSNPDVIKLLITNLGKEIIKQSDKKIWSVSQNDAYNYCECKPCQKMYRKFGSISGAYINMANQIASAYPDKQISTLAYQYTRSAPTKIIPDSNVNVMFCSIECNRSMPLAEDDRSQDFVKDMEDWSKLTSNIFMWDYVVQFNNYLTPFPNFPVLQPNIQFFKKNGVDMMFQQGSNRSWSDLSELKQFLIAKLLWDPEMDVDSLATLFISRYYGEAAVYIKQYYDIMNREIQRYAKDEFLNIFGYPGSYTDSYLSPQLMVQYMSLMDSAQQAVSQNSLLHNRVKRARIPVDFAWVDIAVNNNFEEMPALITTDKGKTINPKIKEILQNLEDYAITDKSINVNERQLKVSDYKKYVLNKLESKLLPNRLDDADISIKTNYSNKYPVGGEVALNDNLFGPLDFHQNWLGFEGEDMVVNIEFSQPTEFSRIQMNFLKAVNSWIFLPLTVTIEVSNDGITYKKLKTLEGDVSDQHYLLKSVPFLFEFETAEAKHLRVTAISIKTCPEWHRGYGKPSWIFVDEIIVN